VTLVEVLLTLVLLAIVFASATPFFLSYLWTSTVTAGGQEMSAALNRARQIAVTTRSSICVRIDGARYRFLRNARCDDRDRWIGLGSDGNGNFRFQSNVRLEGDTDGPVFTPIGSALAEKRIRVIGPRGNSMEIVVDPSGRIYTR